MIEVVYSELLQVVSGGLAKVFEALRFKPIQSTADIWCRDYLPVRSTSGKLIQFRYEPSYLEKYPHLRSIPADVNGINGFDAIYSDINLDGGNVVRFKDRVIISDRIFSENPDRDRTELVNTISDLLEAEVLIFPAIRSEMTGHADGMVRFYNADTLLITQRDVEYLYWQKAVQRFVDHYGFKVIDIPSFIYRSPKVESYNAIGCYINFLETQEAVFVPQFCCAGNRDEEVLRLFNTLYPQKQVLGVDSFDIACEGGVLNCVTWN